MTHYPIYFCQMTQNRQMETVYCIRKHLPYVDKIILVDGASEDETIIYFRNWQKEEPKIEFYIHPWSDHFSNQRNHYLEKVPDNTWVLVSDTDEWFEKETLENLQSLVAQAEAGGYNMVGFQCRSVSLRGSKRVWENLDNYWKRLLFKKTPGRHYEGNPHENLVGAPHKIMDTKFIYEHVKQEDAIFIRGMRNHYTNGGGPNLGENNPYWVELRQITSSIGINDWHNFNRYLLKGNIDERIKDWMYKYKDIDGFDGASEMRETWKTYFEIYHPEEKR